MCRFFATAPRGVTELLKEELESFGAHSVRAQPTGVSFEGDLEVAYRACLWSRLANRVFKVLLQSELANQDDLTEQVSQLTWTEHLTREGTFAVSFSGQGMGIEHTHYGALKIKDGIVDFFEAKTNTRPSVDKEYPDIRVHGHLNRNQLTLSLDLTGRSLHQRGYREGQQVTAPLKENVAAAILMRAQWPALAQQGATFYDPFCGSGTFLIEAAMMASDLAPGLEKAFNMQFLTWRGHNKALWEELIAEAEKREAEGLRHLPKIVGSDLSHRSLDIAEQMIAAAGYDDVIEVRQMSIEQASRWDSKDDAWDAGLIVCNPPYGERLGEVETIKPVYKALGDYLKRDFAGWKAGVLTCNSDLGKSIGIKATRSHEFLNGALECKLFRFDVEDKHFRQAALSVSQDMVTQVRLLYPELKDSENAKMVANRIKKNIKTLKGWLKQTQVEAYRVYDADIPEYALAVDLYHTEEEGTWAVVAEYAPPKTVNPTKARNRLYEALSGLPEALNVDPSNIVFKVRAQQKGTDQYEKLDSQKDFFTITEHQTKLRVNFTDYLDTGLFLDHRNVRDYVATLSVGKRLLNLFCYTATASAEAAVRGCKQSLSLDMSKTYLYWAQHNFWANKVDEQKHLLQREDVLKWLETAAGEQKQVFDVIFMDPPSFSSSKKMDGTLDIQRDHPVLIEQALKLLSSKGKLVFSNNLRKFKLDKQAFEETWEIENITQKTMPKDFLRNPKIHQAWVFSKK